MVRRDMLGIERKVDAIEYDNHLLVRPRGQRAPGEAVEVREQRDDCAPTRPPGLATARQPPVQAALLPTALGSGWLSQM